MIRQIDISDMAVIDNRDKNTAAGDDRLGNVERQSMLYDFYGSLLNENQCEIMALYHEDNLSLSEIAAELGMTRQAVHYSLKKAEHALEEYEKRLGLLAAYMRNMELASEASGIVEELTAEDDPRRERLMHIIDAITDQTN